MPAFSNSQAFSRRQTIIGRKEIAPQQGDRKKVKEKNTEEIFTSHQNRQQSQVTSFKESPQDGAPSQVYSPPHGKTKYFLRRGCTRLTLQKDTVVLDAYIY
jgi:hypothetical protein